MPFYCKTVNPAILPLKPIFTCLSLFKTVRQTKDPVFVIFEPLVPPDVNGMLKALYLYVIKQTGASLQSKMKNVFSVYNYNKAHLT